MELKKTLNMPKGSFEMRGKLPTREPIYIEKCEKMDLYSKMLEATKDGKEFFTMVLRMQTEIFMLDMV